jgi:hypothetical protein
MKKLSVWLLGILLYSSAYSQVKKLSTILDTAKYSSVKIVSELQSSKLSEVIEVCCEVRGSFGGGSKDPGPRNGSSFERKGEQGAGSINHHTHEGNVSSSTSNSPSNPDNKSPTPIPNDQSKDPTPPLISRQQIQHQIKNAPPTAISVKATQQLQASLAAISNLGKIMTAAQLQDLITKDPLEALKAIIDFVKDDKVGKITQNLRNLVEVQSAVITRDALNTSDDLTRAARETTDKFQREIFLRDRTTWENIAADANKAILKPLTMQELGLPYLKEPPIVKIIPFQVSTQSGDIYWLDFWLNKITFINAPFSMVKIILINEYSLDPQFKEIDRRDSTTHTLEISDWKAARYISGSENQTRFGDLWWPENRFGKFFIRSKIIYEIDKMKTAESGWTVLHYDFSQTKYKVYREPLNPGFGQ